MSSLNFAHPQSIGSIHGREVKIRGVIKSGEPRVLTNIYREDTNIVVWQRKLSGTLRQAVDGFLKAHINFETSMILLTLLPSISKMISFCFKPPIIAGLFF